MRKKKTFATEKMLKIITFSLNPALKALTFFICKKWTGFWAFILKGILRTAQQAIYTRW